MPKRHVAIEVAWPFFLGFGLPVTALTFFLAPPFVALGLYAALFPLPLALAPLAAAAASKEVDLASQYAVPPLPLFAPSRRLCDRLLGRASAFVLGKKQAARALAQARVKPALPPSTGAEASTPADSARAGTGADADAAPSPPEALAGESASSEQAQRRRPSEPPLHLQADLARGLEQAKAFAQARERVAKLSSRRPPWDS